MSGNIDPRKKFARQQKSCAGLTYEQKKHRPDCMDEVNRQFVMRPQRIKPKPKPPTPVPPGPRPGPRPGPSIPSLPKATDPFSAIAYTGRRQLGSPNVNPGVIIGTTMAGGGALAMGASAMFAPATAPSGAYRPIPLEEQFDPQAEEFPPETETGDVESGLRARSGYRFTEEGEPAPEGGGVEMQEPSYMDGIRAKLSGRPSGYQQVPTEEPEPEPAEPSAPQPGGEIEMTGQEPPGTMQEVPLDEPAGETAPGYQQVPTEEPEDLDLDDLMNEAREEAQQVQQAAQSAQAAEEGGQVSQELEQAEAQIGEGADIDPADMPSTSYQPGVQEASGQGDFDEDDADDAGDAGDAGDAADVADAADAGAEGGLFEGAADASVLGPIGDVFAVGMLLAGAGLAIAGAVAQSEQSKGAPPAVGMPSSANATILTGSAYTNFVNGLNKQINKASGSTKAQLQAQLSQVENAKQNNRQITVYQADGQPQVAVQMNKTQLAQAILSYQRNPNIFAGVSATRLQAMGLNPKMALGTRGGHQASTGTYYPASAANVAKSGKNVYLNTALSGTPFNKQSDVENQAFSGGGSSLHDTYVQNAQSVINKQTNPQVKAYLTYQLQTYQYQNGMIANKPKTVPKPTGTSASDLQSAETAEANARRQLQQTQAAIAAAKLKQSQTNLVNTQTANINAQTSAAMSTLDAQQTNINNQITRVQNMISSYKTSNPGKPVPSSLTTALNNVQADNTRLAAQRQQVQANAAKQIADVQSIVVPPSNQNASVSTQSPKVLPVAKPVVAVQNKTPVQRAPVQRAPAQRAPAPRAAAPKAPSK